MKPQISEALHYYDATALREKTPLAAVVIAANEDGTVNLVVWDSNGMQHASRNVKFSPDGYPWPSAPFCCRPPHADLAVANAARTGFADALQPGRVG